MEDSRFAPRKQKIPQVFLMPQCILFFVSQQSKVMQCGIKNTLGCFVARQNKGCNVEIRALFAYQRLPLYLFYDTDRPAFNSLGDPTLTNQPAIQDTGFITKINPSPSQHNTASRKIIQTAKANVCHRSCGGGHVNSIQTLF